MQEHAWWPAGVHPRGRLPVLVYVLHSWAEEEAEGIAEVEPWAEAWVHSEWFGLKEKQVTPVMMVGGCYAVNSQGKSEIVL